MLYLCKVAAAVVTKLCVRVVKFLTTGTLFVFQKGSAAIVAEFCVLILNTVAFVAADTLLCFSAETPSFNYKTFVTRVYSE